MEVWSKTWEYLSDDILHRQRKVFDNPELRLSEVDIHNLALIEIEKLLKQQSKSLRDYESMPFPDHDGSVLGHSRLVSDELNYYRKALKSEHARLMSNMTTEQKGVYSKIISAINSDSGGVFFVYGYGGTRKTYMWRTPSAELRSKGHIVLNVASSGIASLLLPGGRTAHSRFGIPLNPHEGSDCNIRKGTPLADLLILCKLIIWDEAPMIHKHCFEAFSDWIASIGDGRAGIENENGGASIEILDDMLIKYSGDPIAAIVEDTYPMFRDYIDDPMFLRDRAILAPTLAAVHSINDYMNSMNSNEGYTYLSSDSTCNSDGSANDFTSELHTPEFLNSIKCSGVPNHELHLKVGTPVMLLRNLDHSMGLCNGTRLVVTMLAAHIIECKILTGAKTGVKVLLPGLNLTPSDNSIPFKFQQRQFPIMISYAMTINKSQGQSLSNVGLYLEKPVFSNGQLYVAVSRVTNRKGLRMLVCGEDNSSTNTTDNVVYKEVFSNI
ncbi:hypothetical protein CASFOL_033237 [Castilleja foliolosa]|uniref:ATP-dependent DNA helicase n=1 Tax=Castilleja foliolosa TaxID=1961234 RepID=A0ABD3C298_9LAMI